MSINVIETMASSQLLQSDENVARESLDRKPFELEHRISGSPLFELGRLRRLADFIKRNSNNVVYDSGEVHVEDRWNQRPPKQYTLEETLERIDCTGAWVILKHTELDPEYRELMDGVMREFGILCGKDLSRLTKNAEAQIMLTSPQRVTPYHIDNECNVLFQIQGEKDVFIFNPSDREVLTPSELERFYIGDWNAGEYKVRFQERAYKFRLAPGGAVHIPVTAPHWVKNDNNVSISLSINFEWVNELVPNVHRANFFLRRLGLNPAPPSRSRTRDKLKQFCVLVGYIPLKETIRGAVRVFRRWRKFGLKTNLRKEA